MNVHLPDTDLSVIARSGQCFRLRTLGENRWRLLTRNHCTEAELLSDGKTRFSCTEEEFHTIWAEYLDLSTDYNAICALADPEDLFLQQAIEYGKGLRLLRQEPWEMLVTFILSQRKNIPAIQKCVEALCCLCGEPIPGWGEHAFPTPRAILSQSPEALAACGMGYRLPYIRGTAAMLAEGWPEGIETLSGDALEKWLLAFPGVGSKVAACVMLFGFHQLDAFPRDVWIQRVEARFYNGRFPTENYPGYAGVMQQYLFFYSQSTGLKE
ncbi:MAG: DNA-3-methyladenine glycosylase family protein [Christensenellales bacterium]|jgi:N-glycosylase/DNA lyase